MSSSYEHYAKLREKVGPQDAVAKHLGISRSVMQRRERGLAAITREARIAMVTLKESGLDLWKKKNSAKKNLVKLCLFLIQLSDLLAG
jgi:uncharacterized protein (DUF2384 family)